MCGILDYCNVMTPPWAGCPSREQGGSFTQKKICISDRVQEPYIVYPLLYMGVSKTPTGEVGTWCLCRQGWGQGEDGHTAENKHLALLLPRGVYTYWVITIFVAHYSFS